MQLKDFFEAVGIPPIAYGREMTWHRPPEADKVGITIVIAHRDGDDGRELAVEATLRERESWGTTTLSAAYMIARLRPDDTLMIREMDGETPEAIAETVRTLIETNLDLTCGEAVIV